MLNPLLIKELRTQTRDRKTYAVGALYVLALSALAFSLIWEASTGERTLDPEHGREMFVAFAVVLTLAVCLICPAFAVGAVSSEKERYTFHQLRVTLLRPHQLLTGKALPLLIHILILLLASLPVAVLMAPLGGISTLEAATCYLIAFISAAAFSLTGLMWSSIYRKTRSSALMTYSVTGLFTFGTLAVPMILTEVFRISISRVLTDFLTALNPFHAVISAFGRGRQLQLAGPSSWSIAIAGYLIISLIAVCVTLLRFRRMRS